MSKNIVEIILEAKDQTSGALKGVKGNLDSLSGQLKLAGVAFVAMGTAAAGAFAYLSKQSIDAADALSETAQKVGLSTEKLSTLGYAAKMAGVDAATLQVALQKLSAGVLDVQQGSAGAKANFDALGISIKDSNGTLKTNDVLLKEVADKFKTIPDGANKTAVAMGLFGKSGAELIPLLNQGSKAIGEMEQRARDLGLEIGSKTAAQANDFNDALEDIQAVVSGVTNVFVAEMLPTLKEFAEWFSSKGPEIVTWFKGFLEDLSYTADALSVIGQVGQTGATILWGAFKLVGDAIATVSVALYNLIEGNFQEAINTLNRGGEQEVAIVNDTAEQVKAIWATKTEANRTELETQKSDHEKQLADIKIADEKAAEEKRKLAEKAAKDAKKLADEETRARERQAQQQMDNAKSTLSYIGGLQSSSSKELFLVGKAAAATNATISGYEAYGKALASVPYPYNFVAAGLVGTAAAANVAQILSTPAPFAKGGVVQGDPSTGDSVHAILTPQEVVVNAMQQENLASNIGGGSVTVNLTIGDKTLAKQINRLWDNGLLEFAI